MYNVLVGGDDRCLHVTYCRCGSELLHIRVKETEYVLVGAAAGVPNGKYGIIMPYQQ